MKILTLFLLIFCILLLKSKFIAGILHVDEQWDTQRNTLHLINLTIIMCKDAMLKLRMADRIQEDYKNSFAYELGLLASGIMDKFKHMLAIYKNFSNPRTFMDVKRRQQTKLYLNAYHVMQSDYNEIRAERDLFLDIVEQHRIRKEAKTKKSTKLEKFLAASKLKDILDKAKGRRSMQNVELIEMEDKINSKMTMDLNKRVKLMEKQKVKETGWVKNNNAAEAEYKKKLRYIKWADKWQKFNPEIEGVDIPDNLAKIGFTNTSNFLLKEFKGTI